MDDNEIREALGRRQDDLAFRLLVAAHGRAVYSRCRRILKSHAAAEDAMQQALMAAFQHRGRLRDVDNLRAWLLQTASRKCIDALRSGKRGEPLRGDRSAADPPDEQLDVLARLRAREDQQALEDCLAELEPELRAALLMKYQDGIPWARIAEVVGVEADAIRMRVQRGAIARMAECLAGKEVTP